MAAAEKDAPSIPRKPYAKGSEVGGRSIRAQGGSDLDYFSGSELQQGGLVKGT